MGRSLLVTEKQVLKSLSITRLRGIKDLDIDFLGSSVTGIFGLNGSGKTTILQTLVCLFRSKDGKENTKMSRFFKYTSSGDRWNESIYSATVDYYQLSGRRHHQETDKVISYSKPRSEWSPRQASKPDRTVVYIKLSECIPDIEKVSESKVTFTPLVGEDLDIKISCAATQIMNVQYRPVQTLQETFPIATPSQKQEIALQSGGRFAFLRTFSMFKFNKRKYYKKTYTTLTIV